MPSSLTVDPAEVRFPARCVRCGASPSRAITLETFKGWDLIYLRWGHDCEIEAPSCDRCWSRRLKGRILWFTSIIALIVGAVGAAAGLVSVLGKGAEGYVLGPLIPALLVFMYYVRTREIDVYQRWFSPVWLRKWQPKARSVELHFRDETLRRDVAVLSGLESGQVSSPVDYRSPAGAPPPPAWEGAPARPLKWWLVAGVGIAMIVVGFVEFFQYAKFEETGRGFSDNALIVLLYELAGKWAVLGLFAVIGGLVTTAGIAMRWKRKGLLDTIFSLLNRG